MIGIETLDCPNHPGYRTASRWSSLRRSRVLWWWTPSPLDSQCRYPCPGNGLVVESAGQASHADGADYQPIVENGHPARDRYQLGVPKGLKRPARATELLG